MGRQGEEELFFTLFVLSVTLFYSSQEELYFTELGAMEKELP